MYSLNLRADDWPVITRTYSEHGNAYASFNPSRFRLVIAVVAMANHLNVRIMWVMISYNAHYEIYETLGC